MASTYSTNLALELIGTGDQAGTWGVTTNTNLGTLLEQAISGYVTQAVSTGTDTTITIPNGSTGVARNMYIELTGTGGTNTNLIVPANKKLYFIFNNASGAVTVKVSGQTGVSVPTGKKMILVSNGTDIVNGVNYIADFGTNSFTVTNLTATSATITNLIATTATVSDLSATVLRAASASITNLALTSLTISSLSITNVSVASATVSSNLTLSGGTANGVLYLNGSKVATSGSALVFDGTNLGIGTSSPDIFGRFYTRSVGISSSGTTALQINGTTYGTIDLGAGGTRTTSITGSSTEAQIATVTAIPILFATNGAERMRLDSSGNLGIGTSSPAYKLDVTNSANSNTTIGVTNSTSGTSALARFLAVSNAGNAFFGMTSPGYTDISSAADALVINASSASGGIVLAQDGVGQAWLNTSGNLGIGTTSPSDILTLAGGASGSYGLTINNAKVGGGTKAIFQYDATNAIALVGGNTTNGLAFQTLTGGSLTTKATIDSSGNLGIGTSSPNTGLVPGLVIGNGTDNKGITFFGTATTQQNIAFTDTANAQQGLIQYDHTSDYMRFFTLSNERARIDSSGNLFCGGTTGSSRLNLQTTSSSSADSNYITMYNAGENVGHINWINGNGNLARITGTKLGAGAQADDGILTFSTATNTVLAERARITSAGIFLVGKATSDILTAGVELQAGGDAYFTAPGPLQYLNRTGTDGTLVEFRQDNTTEGTISVSGSTVSYNAFAGSHWSQLQDGSKPDILRGTVMESINELCVWPDETNERLPKSKVSDTAGSKKVYGVFMAWDNDWTTTNDMYITAVGAFICRVNASVTVQEGDLLESNGDGTARVQADDIIRSSTIGKVTSTVKTHQYDDGSYCVPTVLYCG